MDKFNIKSKFGENSLQYQQAWKAAVKGLVAGIGGTSSQIIKDDYAMATALKGEGPPIPPSPTSPYARTVLRPEINKGQLGKLQKLKEKIITTKTVEKKAADVMGDLYATANESNTPIALQSTPYAKAESREKIVKDAKDVGITTTFNNRDLSYDEIIKKIDKAIKESATLAVYNPIDFTVEQSQVAAKRLHSAFKNNKDTNVSNFFVMENGAVKGLNGQLYFSPMESKLYLSDKDGKNFIPIDAGNIDESLKTIFTQNRQYLNNILGLDLNNTSTGTALLKDLRGAAKEYVKSNLSTIISKFTQDFNSIPELRSKYKLSDYLAKQRDAYEEFVYNELLQQASNPGIINSPISDIINTLTLTTGSSSQKVANP